MRTLLEARSFVSSIPHQLSLNILTGNQHLKIKGPIINMDNKFNEVFPSFDPFDKKFSFHILPKQDSNNLKAHIHSLNDIAIKSSLDSTITLIVSNTSIKNQVITSILHVHIYNRPVIETLYYTVNITSMEAELFAIRYNINQATNLMSINKIVVITNSIHFARKIFNSSSHSYQVHVISISYELRNFIDSSCNNTIKFWECPSCLE